MIIERKNYELFGKMLIEKLVISSPFKVPSPMPNEACFLYVIQGEIDYQLDQNLISIPAKDAVLLKCGNYFGQMLSTKSSKLQKIIIVHFHPDILKKVYDKELPEILRPPKKIDTTINLEQINNDLLIQKYIEGLLFYFDNPSLVSEEILILKLKEIILLLTQTKNVIVIQQLLSQLFSPSTYSFKQIIEDNLYSNISSEALAQLTNLSISSFKREFKKIFDDTPSNYLKNKKLEKAAELLTLSDERISTISFSCGFNDLAHFSKCFHKKYNTTPSAFRQDQKN
ncbi:MAG: AraC family transcriptional regulator [Chitinophagaceae bacterium]|nr:AraC family transcriptional regulator [Chitinophagaceae bacterium]